MDKTKIKYAINVVMLISFILALLTGIAKFPVLLNAMGPLRGIFHLYIMSAIHDWSGVVLGVTVFAHLVLNFNWIMSVTKGFFKKKVKK